MTPSMLLPGRTIGILGSGQLGRMTALAAARLGYHVHCYSPEKNSPAGEVCAREWVGTYEDTNLLGQFALSCDLVTFEFENVPLTSARTVAQHTPLAPGSAMLAICQDRLEEKEFLRQVGVAVPPFMALRGDDDLKRIPAQWGYPSVVKTARMGYDGKGQAKVESAVEVGAAFEKFGRVPCILESFVNFRLECSVIVARSASGEVRCYPPIENIHAHHILDISLAPASLAPDVAHQAESIARLIAEKISLVGILAVEMFVTADGEILVNELAPRPHNSGHLTIEACACSQFEQHVRAICNLPLGDSSFRSPAGMVNLLGDLWHSGEPDWRRVLDQTDAHLHLYGKTDARPGRKMGHITILGASPVEIRTRLLSARERLTRKE